MKAKDLIKLLESIDGDAEVCTPGHDEYGAATDFKLEPGVLTLDVSKATTHFAPHEFDIYPDKGQKNNGYLLDGTW